MALATPPVVRCFRPLQSNLHGLSFFLRLYPLLASLIPDFLRTAATPLFEQFHNSSSYPRSSRPWKDF